ncbi:cyclase family protein [Candidatus Nomurabacteria bacterium]|nr:cyclase family protein [Candidatus Nomurabacteria bacterium]
MNKKLKIVDLTHTLLETVPSWDKNPAFHLSTEYDYKNSGFRAQKIAGELSAGTHMDAPAHFIESGRTIEKLTLKELFTDCVIVDVSSEADENYIIMPSIVEKFEKNYGKIPEGSFVIFYTGWDAYFETREKYHNNHKFPSVHVSTAEMLLKRNIAGLGIDTLSPDTGKKGFPVHLAILGADKYLVENINNAGLLPPIGAKSMVLPIKIKGGTEAPIRLVALIKA